MCPNLCILEAKCPRRMLAAPFIFELFFKRLKRETNRQTIRNQTQKAYKIDNTHHTKSFMIERSANVRCSASLQGPWIARLWRQRTQKQKGKACNIFTLPKVAAGVTPVVKWKVFSSVPNFVNKAQGQSTVRYFVLKRQPHQFPWRPERWRDGEWLLDSFSQWLRLRGCTEARSEAAARTLSQPKGSLCCGREGKIRADLTELFLWRCNFFGGGGNTEKQFRTFRTSNSKQVESWSFWKWTHSGCFVRSSADSLEEYTTGRDSKLDQICTVLDRLSLHRLFQRLLQAKTRVCHDPLEPG